MGKFKPFKKERKFSGKTFKNPSFHRTKSDAKHIAKRFKESPNGSNARVVKGNNILGETRYVVYRRYRRG